MNSSEDGEYLDRTSTISESYQAVEEDRNEIIEQQGNDGNRENVGREETSRAVRPYFNQIFVVRKKHSN